MALPRSLNRIDLPVHTVGDAGRARLAARAFAAQAERAWRADRLRRPQPALPLRQQGVPGLAGQARRRRPRPRGHRGPRPGRLPALPRVHRRRAVGRADDVRAPAHHRRPPAALDPRRLLPRPQLAGPRPRVPRHLQRRRPPEAPGARGRPARAPAAARHRQRRPADPLRRPPAQDPLREQAVRQPGSACRPTTCSGTR